MSEDEPPDRASSKQPDPEPPAAPQPAEPEPGPPPGWSSGKVFAGIGLTFGLHLAVFAVLGLLSFLACLGDDVACGLLFGLLTVAFLLIGVAQLVYVGPLLVVLRRRGRNELVQGLIIGAAVTFLLNAACWGLLATQLTQL